MNALFKVSAEFRASKHKSQVKRINRKTFEFIRHQSFNDTLSQALCNRSFSDSGIPYVQGIIFYAPAQHLNCPLNFFCAPDKRIIRALCRKFRHIDAVTLKRSFPPAAGVFFLRGRTAFFKLRRGAADSPYPHNHFRKPIMINSIDFKKIRTIIFLFIKHTQQNVSYIHCVPVTCNAVKDRAVHYGLEAKRFRRSA